MSFEKVVFYVTCVLYCSQYCGGVRKAFIFWLYGVNGYKKILNLLLYGGYTPQISLEYYTDGGFRLSENTYSLFAQRDWNFSDNIEILPLVY